MNVSSLANIEAMAVKIFVFFLLAFIIFVLLELCRKSQLSRQGKLWIGAVLGLGCVGFVAKGLLHWVLI